MYRCSITSDLLNIANQYNLWNVIWSYLAGGKFPEKRAWKCIVKEKVHQCQEDVWKTGLLCKEAHRFARIQPTLYPNYIYYTVKRNMKQKQKLLSLVSLLSARISEGSTLCLHCNTEYIDCTDHILNSCRALNNIRNMLWDTIVDVFNVEAEVNLFSRDDDDIVDILLGKDWSYLNNVSDKDLFLCTISTFIHKMVDTF